MKLPNNCFQWILLLLLSQLFLYACSSESSRRASAERQTVASELQDTFLAKGGSYSGDPAITFLTQRLLDDLIDVEDSSGLVLTSAIVANRRLFVCFIGSPDSLGYLSYSVGNEARMIGREQYQIHQPNDKYFYVYFDFDAPVLGRFENVLSNGGEVSLAAHDQAGEIVGHERWSDSVTIIF